jgi:hypothetical protein
LELNMPDIISCPICQRKLQVPESYLGQQVQCPSCKAMFTAASASAVALPPPVPPTAQPAGPADWQRPARAEEEPRRRRDDYDDQPRRRDRYDDDYDDRMDFRRRRPYMPHRGAAVLVLGILSLVVCGILGPFAWVMGSNDLAEMRAGRMDPEGEGTTRAGQICGIIGTVRLVIVEVLIGLIFFVALLSAPRRF